MLSVSDLQLKIEKIREFDSLIDFARSSLQLDIVFQLASSRKPLSSAEIARALGQRKKPILDALRKLEIKGLVKKSNSRGDLYELTELGRNAIEDLFAILGVSDLKTALRSGYGRVKARDMVKIVIPVNYIHDTLVALGTSRRNELSLSTLSQIIGLSPQRLAMYLDPYAEPRSEVRLFKKYRKEAFTQKITNKLFGKTKTQVHYRLTSLGMETFYRLSLYSRIKGNPILRLLIKVFGNYSPKLVMKRTAMVNMVLGSIALATLLAMPSLAYMLLALWASYNIVLGTLIVVGYK